MDGRQTKNYKKETSHATFLRHLSSIRINVQVDDGGKQNKGEAKKIDAHATFLRLLPSIRVKAQGNDGESKTKERQKK
ncbi:MAG: hypothetical protein LBQ64_06010 [Bacteroidales bacterium]|nr:hypothetical protein [Bacteroidales bacterium]